MYDKKLITCHKCGKFIGEIELDACITNALCGDCTIAKVEDKKSRTTTRLEEILVA